MYIYMYMYTCMFMFTELVPYTKSCQNSNKVYVGVYIYIHTIGRSSRSYSPEGSLGSSFQGLAPELFLRTSGRIYPSPEVPNSRPLRAPRWGAWVTWTPRMRERMAQTINKQWFHLLLGSRSARGLLQLWILGKSSLR